MLNELMCPTFICISVIGEAVQKKNHRIVLLEILRQNTSFSMALPSLSTQRSDYSGLLFKFIHIIVTFLCMWIMCIELYKLIDWRASQISTEQAGFGIEQTTKPIHWWIQAKYLDTKSYSYLKDSIFYSLANNNFIFLFAYETKPTLQCKDSKLDQETAKHLMSSYFFSEIKYIQI